MTPIRRIGALLLLGSSLFACAGSSEAEVEPVEISHEALNTISPEHRRLPKVTIAKGHWSVGPLTILSLDPETGEATAIGSDTFTGTFTGTATYFLSGRFGADGSFRGFSDETITGTAPDGTSGTIREAHQPFYVDPEGNFIESSPITSGTGDWAGSTGHLFYKGKVNIADPEANTPGQGGEYEGIWIRPASN